MKLLIRLVPGCLVAMLGAPLAHAVHEGVPGVPADQQGLATIGAKLNDPTSNIWALQAEFDLNISRGRLSDNDWKYGGAMIFQPVMPFELNDTWKLLTRPVVPIVFTAPIPKLSTDGDIKFDYKSGLGDIVLPLLLSPKPTSRFALGKSFSWGLGPTWIFPSASSENLGSEKWQVGPAAVALYKSHTITAGFLGQYWWSFAGDSSRDDTSQASILYFFWYMLGTWQIGMNPTISFDNEASSGNQWEVPIGITVGNTIKVGKVPMKIQVGLDYSVVHRRDFGSRWRVKLLLTPVIPSLVKKPLLELVQR